MRMPYWQALTQKTSAMLCWGVLRGATWRRMASSALELVACSITERGHWLIQALALKTLTFWLLSQYLNQLKEQASKGQFLWMRHSLKQRLRVWYRGLPWCSRSDGPDRFSQPCLSFRNSGFLSQFSHARISSAPAQLHRP